MRIVPGLFAAASLTSASRGSARPQFESAAPIAYMVDMASGAVLFDKNSDRKIPPASMAKMMTAYVAFDLINQGKLKPEKKFTVRPEIWKKWNNTGSTMFLKSNEQVSVADLLHGVVTLSGNDAAIVLAEGISGSEADFVLLMNAKAQQLGMKDSHFGTANGWPDEGRTLTTAQDLAFWVHGQSMIFRSCIANFMASRSIAGTILPNPTATRSWAKLQAQTASRPGIPMRQVTASLAQPSKTAAAS